MIIFLSILSIYIITSIILYICMNNKCKKNKVFNAPKHSITYYILSFTWGLPMTLFGCVVALILICAGERPVKYGWNWCFELYVNFGLELGIFFISPIYGSDSLKQHECGHSIQNIYLGIFTPLVVSIPSAVRYWYREIRKKIKKPCTSKYDDIWFEGSATESGRALMERLGK